MNAKEMFAAGHKVSDFEQPFRFHARRIGPNLVRHLFFLPSLRYGFAGTYFSNQLSISR